MDKRRTATSQKALEIYLEIKDVQEPFSRIYKVDNPVGVKEGIRRNVRYKGSAQEITTAVRDDKVIVGTRYRTRQKSMVDVIRELVIHVDDDAMYARIMQLVEVE